MCTKQLLQSYPAIKGKTAQNSTTPAAMRLHVPGQLLLLRKAPSGYWPILPQYSSRLSGVFAAIVDVEKAPPIGAGSTGSIRHRRCIRTDHLSIQPRRRRRWRSTSPCRRAHRVAPAQRQLPPHRVRQRPPATTPVPRPPPTSAAVRASSMACACPLSAKAAARSTTGLISTPTCRTIGIEGGPGRRFYGP